MSQAESATSLLRVVPDYPLRLVLKTRLHILLKTKGFYSKLVGENTGFIMGTIPVILNLFRNERFTYLFQPLVLGKVVLSTEHPYFFVTVFPSVIRT